MWDGVVARLGLSTQLQETMLALLYLDLAAPQVILLKWILSLVKLSD